MYFEAFPETTPAGKAFKQGWDTYVKAQHLPNVFWDPVDIRWENYPRDEWGFSRVQLPVVPLGFEYWAERTILHEVINIGASTRIVNAKVVWNPRDGFWYQWQKLVDPVPSPPPPPPWLVQSNADLDALARNTHLTPEERFQARNALIQSAYGGH